VRKPLVDRNVRCSAVSMQRPGSKAIPTADGGAKCAATVAPLPALVAAYALCASAATGQAGQFWYGTGALCTMLGADGIWRRLPKAADGYSQKVFWWSACYRASADPRPVLAVNAGQLDADSRQFAASVATNAVADSGQAMLVGVAVPEPGCWDITAHSQGHDLMFVVRVIP
jgi:hypothetical protein